MIKRTLVIFFSLLTFLPIVNAYEFQHVNCRIKVDKKGPQNELIHDLFLGHLKKKNYQVTFFNSRKKIYKHDLYLDLKAKRLDEGIFKPCQLIFKIKKAKYNYASTSDMVLYSSSIVRKVPRTTFKGNERCKRAVKDAMTHIPQCITSGIPRSGETKRIQ
jgi:hypothetical protein